MDGRKPGRIVVGVVGIENGGCGGKILVASDGSAMHPWLMWINTKRVGKGEDKVSVVQMAATAEDKAREVTTNNGQMKPAPNPEVVETAARRKFTAEYKLRILREADRCAPGELGALLRREGLYSAHLAKWRKQRERAEKAALSPQKTGRKAHETNPLVHRVSQLERENERLKQRLQQAEAIIEVQKKISALLENPLRGGSN